ncbi:hypothetical protein CQS04_10350 [Chryseomicrobium excrementi]|uniref:Diguanylate cyclase n=1 Tax=Chryseomicrobium excrementi TaxID=2041346 RepID=A0A2M9EYL9_9BACL|nr:PAS domain S-box protein [Chryseomicrobium excrementi]PJK16296.1 hypothetical protein CQS04_10350 [Chryseomicrobium excrementi]
MEKPVIHHDTDIDLLLQMLDHVTDLVFLMGVHNDQFVYRFINKKARQILGLSDATLGQSILEVHTPEKAEPLHQAYERVVQLAEPLVFRQQVRTPRGMFTGESKLTPLYNKNQLVTHVLGIVQDISTLKLSEEASELNRQRYKSLFDFHPDGIIAYDLKGRLIDGNLAASTISGYPFQDASERGFKNFILEEYKDITRKSFARCIQNSESVQYETAIYHKAGHIIYLTVVNIPINVNGKTVGVYEVFKDISRERELSMVLQEKNNDLQTLWNTAINPIFQLKLDGSMARVNPAFCQLFEYTENEIQDTMNQIIPEHLHGEMEALQKRLDKMEPIESYETQRVTKSGKLLDILASYTPVYNEHGEPTAIHVVYNNITKLKNIQRELDQSREKYKVITEHAFDVIKVFNRNGRADYLSPSIKLLLGHEPSECIGKRFTQFIHPEDHSVVQKNLQLLLSTRKHCTMDLRMKHIEGHYIWMEVVASPVIERGRVINIITISRDISERYSIQEALKKMAYYDHLSGLPNRRAFDDRLQELLDNEEHSPSLALLLADGNQFKRINDTYGHDAGDAVIVEMADRLTKSVRQDDLVARLGGDEIGILLEDIHTTEQITSVIDRIIEHFKEPFVYKEQTIAIEIALGIALYPQDAQDKKALFIAADNALYASKKNSTTSFTYFEELLPKKKQ